jgi:protein involved in polysaccharide export with SLBB domain
MSGISRETFVMKFKKVWLSLRSKQRKSENRTVSMMGIFRSSFVRNLPPLALSLLFLTACATSHDMDWDKFMKEMAVERKVEEDAFAGPDKPASDLPPVPESDPVVTAGEVTIQPDSVLQVSVREDSALDGSYSVNEISAIQLGYVGPVFLRNMTEEKAADKIKEVLENRFFNRATVSVRILRASYDKVAVHGQVAKGGVIKIGSGDRISLNDALLRAGNFTASIKGVRVRIVRGGLLSAVSPSVDGEVYELLDENNNPKVPDVFLWNNDVAFVFTSSGLTEDSTVVEEGAKEILVLGEVNRQGIYNFNGSTPCTLMHLIFKMNGFPTYADTEKIKIIRPDGDGGEEEMIVDASKILEEGDPEADVRLENGDRVIVSARRISLFK